MKIYFDENLPKHLADGFQVLQQPEGLKTGRQIEIKYIPDTFGRGTLIFLLYTPRYMISVSTYPKAA